jgi:RNA polymerase sigma factor (sigma-70 family)
MSVSDLDLLKQFARDHSQDAFSEIVRRHVDLVYSAALRQVRSSQLAEEVAQSVFSDLARNAGKLKPDTVLTPWLYAVTRRTAVDVARKESRRQLREQIAVEMNSMNATANDWNEIGPLLDDAMAALDETDRSVILLRFFENKSLREVGESLKISDDAAQKRASRAVERLREFFSKRNVTVGASGLAVLLAANAVQAAPVGLAAAISAAAVLTGAAATAMAITATKVIAMTTMQKIIIGAALAAAVGTGAFEVRQASQLREQNATLQQQLAPLSAQIQQLQLSLSDATNQIAGLMEENGQLETKSNEDELLKLRNEVTLLKKGANETQGETSNPTELIAIEWMEKANLLKQYLDQHPSESIPEIQLAHNSDWLISIFPDLPYYSLKTQDDYERAVHTLRSQAEARFGNLVAGVLRKYEQANNGQFPTDLSQLEPFCDAEVENILLQLYYIAPASIVKGAKVDGDWIITRKTNANPSAESYIAIFPSGYTYFHR